MKLEFPAKAIPHACTKKSQGSGVTAVCVNSKCITRFRANLSINSVNGINPEHYKTYVPRDRHRLLPKGLHTGTDNWNAQWRRLFSQLAIPKQKVILKLLNEMLKRLSR